MKKWVLLLFILISKLAIAQGINNNPIPQSRQKTNTTEETNNSRTFSFDKRKLRFGANLGLSLSSNYTYLNLGPQFGYQFNQHFMAGGGIKYNYSKISVSDYTKKNNLLGLNLFGYTYPISFITLFAQPEINYIWSNIKMTNTTNDEITTKGFTPSLIVGAGLRLGYSHITINYDLLQKKDSPHPEGFYLGVSAFF